MPELRWVLLTLGVLLIVVIYLWGRGVLRRPLLRKETPRSFKEPYIAPEALEPASAPEPDPDADAVQEEQDEREETPVTAETPPGEDDAPAAVETIDRIVTVRFIPKGALNGEQAVLALRGAGLRHGRYGIFHRFDEARPNEPLFSVANLTEPGSFDLKNLAETVIPGMSFFMVLPGIGDPVERFDLMVDTARSLALDLDAELHDEKGSSWSIQRERYVREEIIEYRHQKLRA